MDPLTDTSLLLFLTELGRRLAQPSRLYLLGGGAMLLLGSPRATLDLDYLGDDVHKADWQLDVERLADELRIDLDAVALERFIPIPQDSSERHIFFKRFDQLEVYIFDPYAIAISKIERGFDSDLDDVVFMLRSGFIELDRLAEMLVIALQRAVEFDLHPDTSYQHFDLVRRKYSAT